MTLRGVTPLLAANQKHPLSVEEGQLPTRAELGIYLDGQLAFPAIAIRSALLLAVSTGYKIKGQCAESILADSLLNVFGRDRNTQWLALTDYRGTPLTIYETDTRWTTTGMQKWLRIDAGWQIAFGIEYDEKLIQGTEILRFLRRAEIMAGLGDFSPQRGGDFGRFKILAS